VRRRGAVGGGSRGTTELKFIHRSARKYRWTERGLKRWRATFLQITEQLIVNGTQSKIGEAARARAEWNLAGIQVGIRTRGRNRWRS